MLKMVFCKISDTLQIKKKRIQSTHMYVTTLVRTYVYIHTNIHTYTCTYSCMIIR